MTKKDNHDAYIAAATEQFRAMLGQLRARYRGHYQTPKKSLSTICPDFRSNKRSSRAMLPLVNNVVYMLTRAQLLPMPTRSLL